MNNMNEGRESMPFDMNEMNKNDNKINDTVNNINANEMLNNAKHPDRHPAAYDFAAQNEAQLRLQAVRLLRFIRIRLFFIIRQFPPAKKENLTFQREMCFLPLYFLRFL